MYYKKKRDIVSALEGAIKKWDNILKGEEIDKGAQNCPLCVIFKNAWNDCLGCPVRERTDASHCYFTPYEKWDIHHKFYHKKDMLYCEDNEGTIYTVRYILCNECKRIAQDIKKFLEGLRQTNPSKGGDDYDKQGNP